MGRQRRKKKVNKATGAREQKQGNRVSAAIPARPSQETVAVQQSQRDVDKDIGAANNAANSDGIYRLEVWQHRFTAALVAATIVQAIFAVRQWSEMVAQNNIMLGQMQQTERAIKQTDETIKQSRLAQRPWLAAYVEEIPPLDALTNPDMTHVEFDEWLGKWTIYVRNVGQTPAIDIYWDTGWRPEYGEDATFSFDSLYERQVRTEAAIGTRGRDPSLPGITLNPGDSMGCPMYGEKRGIGTLFMPSSSPDERVISFYKSRITGAFVYTDMWGGEHSMFCCFRHNSDTGRLELEECSVDYPSINNPAIPPPKGPRGTRRPLSAKQLLEGNKRPIIDLLHLHRDGKGDSRKSRDKPTKHGAPPISREVTPE